MKKILFFLLLSYNFCLQAQNDATNSTSTSPEKKWNFGVELDALPYATGGYFAGAWIGKEQWRTRALLADVNLPDFTTKTGFTNHHVRAYALLLDHFLKKTGKVGGSALDLFIGKAALKVNPTIHNAILKTSCLMAVLAIILRYTKIFMHHLGQE